ncbi:SMP-30/gluconolactonase/LRE family protein [Oceanicoccus sagamiensis]|uniref:Gluconolactonase n=1 Tax=Oceanicoccus sagamiensis TaxID=716816 RepID=A0A1X9NBE2_9GAMM|nr:SMP-30/gluconolactonase/LRE family protein [Oceanicoccus sagamiensis]ARN73235.1 gluconolactonase [Oceanicoccus sagamiensis]
MKKIIPSLVTLIIVIGGFLVWPSPVDSVAWHVPVAKPLNMASQSMADARIIPLSGAGPEDIAVDSQGRIYGGLHDGRIIRIGLNGKEEVFATINGGRPLGLHFDKQQNLIVADAWKGLLSFDQAGTMTVLSTESDGLPFLFTDDLDIASDGRIYFSDASYQYPQPDYILDLIESRPYGRLLRYDPSTGETETLLGGLYFANGIALSQNEDFVLVNETGRYRVSRYWLKGEKAGSTDTFIDNLPGYPDGISANRQGTFWLALPNPRSPQLDQLHSDPAAKNLMMKLPAWLHPLPPQQGHVLALNEQGEITARYLDSHGEKVWMVTSAQQEGNCLYLGSLEAPQIVVIELDKKP